MLTNNENISLPLAVWLAQDDYDHNDDPMVISTSSLIKPIRQLVLSRRYKLNEKEGDIASLIASRIGTALHSAIEASWVNTEKRNKALLDLGYPQRIIDKILFNPTDSELYDGCIPIYMEQREQRKIGNYTISGMYDIIFNTRLKDIKSTGTYTYEKQSKTLDYQRQGSIYRWLNPDKVKESSMDIEFIFTDWKRGDALRNKAYPQSKLLTQNIPLLSIGETESYIQGKLYQLDLYKDAPQEAIPRCSDEDLWIDKTVWKYYKDPNKTTRSTKNFDSLHEANIRLAADKNVGVVKEVKGTPKACNYCALAEVCDQRKEYVTAGILT